MRDNDSKEDIKYEILSNDIKKVDYCYKLVVIGETSVGKSCLTNRGVKGKFEEDNKPTIGIDYFLFNIKFEDKIIQLKIFDTCGAEKYKSLIYNFYRNTSLAVIVYAINEYILLFIYSRNSFNNINEWLTNLNSNTNDCKIFLIGNKADLEDDRKISTQEGEDYKRKHNFDVFMECSAKTGFNAENLFITAAKFLYYNSSIYEENNSNTGDNTKENKGFKLRHKFEDTDILESTNNETCC